MVTRQLSRYIGKHPKPPENEPHPVSVDRLAFSQLARVNTLDLACFAVHQYPNFLRRRRTEKTTRTANNSMN